MVMDAHNADPVLPPPPNAVYVLVARESNGSNQQVMGCFDHLEMGLYAANFHLNVSVPNVRWEEGGNLVLFRTEKNALLTGKSIIEIAEGVADKFDKGCLINPRINLLFYNLRTAAA